MANLQNIEKKTRKLTAKIEIKKNLELESFIKKVSSVKATGHGHTAFSNPPENIQIKKLSVSLV